MNRLQQLQKPALITRLAPTPSGFLHIGNVYSFLATWLMARKNHGQILLRIDDLDRERVRPEYVENIFRTLEWLGLDWDLGPSGVEEFERHYSQRHRTGLYRQALDELQRSGQVFACDCSRKKLKDLGTDDSYPGICLTRQLNLSGQDVAWRLNTSGTGAVALTTWDGRKQEVPLPPSQAHFIVRRRDEVPAYHLASVVDDVHFGVNTIVRGSDLYDSTLAQLCLAGAMGIRAFSDARFLHHVLILDQGEKLSKSQQSPSVIDGFYPDRARLFRKVGAWLGLEDGQCESLTDMLQFFSAGKLNGELR